MRCSSSSREISARDSSKEDDDEPRLSRTHLLRSAEDASHRRAALRRHHQQVSGAAGRPARDEPVGPHPVANAQVIFRPDQFQPVVEWLMMNRDGLDVLIHPLTEDSVDDHSIYAMWLGLPLPLKLETLRRNYRAELLPSA